MVNKKKYISYLGREFNVVEIILFKIRAYYLKISAVPFVMYDTRQPELYSMGNVPLSKVSMQARFQAELVPFAWFWSISLCRRPIPSKLFLSM